MCFYNDKEYDDWKKINSIKDWSIKYYKGLGTSTAKEFKEYFEKKKIVEFISKDDCKEQIDMVFRKNRADDRKKWLEAYNKELSLDTSKAHISPMGISL